MMLQDLPTQAFGVLGTEPSLRAQLCPPLTSLHSPQVPTAGGDSWSPVPEEGPARPETQLLNPERRRAPRELRRKLGILIQRPRRRGLSGFHKYRTRDVTGPPDVLGLWAKPSRQVPGPLAHSTPGCYGVTLKIPASGGQAGPSPVPEGTASCPTLTFLPTLHQPRLKG